MFGKNCYRLDEWLQQGDPMVTPDRYAQELLAELLTRAQPLCAGYYHVLGLAPGEDEKPGPDYIEALENLAAAVGVFEDDVKEAIIRGRRARVLCAGSLGNLYPGDGSIETDASLATIGGALIAKE